MIDERPRSGRLDAGFVRRILLVLLAAFALAEFPFGARELSGSPARLLATLAEERRVVEPAERGLAPVALLHSETDWNNQGRVALDMLDGGEPDPVAAPDDALPGLSPDPSAAGLVAPWAAIAPPPCKAVRSRAPPGLA